MEKYEGMDKKVWVHQGREDFLKFRLLCMVFGGSPDHWDDCVKISPYETILEEKLRGHECWTEAKWKLFAMEEFPMDDYIPATKEQLAGGSTLTPSRRQLRLLCTSRGRSGMQSMKWHPMK